MRDPRRKDFVGKTIRDIKFLGVNSWRFTFDDDSTILLDVEHMGHGIHGIQVETEKPKSVALPMNAAGVIAMKPAPKPRRFVTADVKLPRGWFYRDEQTILPKSQGGVDWGSKRLLLATSIKKSANLFWKKSSVYRHRGSSTPSPSSLILVSHLTDILGFTLLEGGRFTPDRIMSQSVTRDRLVESFGHDIQPYLDPRRTLVLP